MAEHDERPDEVDDLARPIDPPSGVRRLTGGDRQLTRRVIAPAALLLVSVPVVALLFLNLRSVSGDSAPASAEVRSSATASPSASASASASSSATASASPSPSAPAVSSVSATTGPAAGGTVLTVTGSDLGAVTQVLFGPLNGSNLQHVSDTTFTVVVPPGAPGSVPLTFKTGTEDATSAVSSWTYR